MENLDDSKKWLARNTNPNKLSGTLLDATKDTDLVIGVSGPGIIPVEAIEKMAETPSSLHLPILSLRLCPKKFWASHESLQPAEAITPIKLITYSPFPEYSVGLWMQEQPTSTKR